MNKKLIEWSKSEFNDLPWRKNRSLYGTLVSEIMLQQTTVSTVINHYDRFMNTYPTPFDFAKTTEEELLISWKGLGYYRRARNLKKACIEICEKYDGNIPLDYEKLIQIPGIGDYTANAILAIGNNESTLALDANLDRVIARLYGLKSEKGLKLNKEIKDLFNRKKICTTIEEFGGRSFNEALMDLGRHYCQAKKANCMFCPLNKECYAYKENTVLEYPVFKKVKKEKFNLTVLRLIIKNNKNEYLVYKKASNQWLSGQYEVPTFILSTDDSLLEQYPRISGSFDFLPEFKTAITKYSIINKVLWLDREEFKKLNLKIENYTWSDRNLSTASLKAIDL